MLLNGKRIIITGGVTGTGKAAAELFVKEGAIITTMSRKSPDDPKVAAFTEHLNQIACGNGKATHRKLDITVQEDVNRVFDEAVADMGGLDALLNCAGLENQCPSEELTKELLYQTMDVNLLGTVFTDIAAFRHMKEKGGSILNSGSMAGVIGWPGLGSYSASKGAVIAFTRTVAKEWGPYMVRVNAACISARTDMVIESEANMTPEELEYARQGIRQNVPLGGKYGTPEQVAKFYLFMVSDLSDYITGQTLNCDGGYVFSR